MINKRALHTIHMFYQAEVYSHPRSRVVTGEPVVSVPFALVVMVSLRLRTGVSVSSINYPINGPNTIF